MLVYHPTFGLMQILHFNCLRTLQENCDWFQVAKFGQPSFILFTHEYFFNLHLLTLLLPFCDGGGDAKTMIRPFALVGHRSIAHWASPHGLIII